MQWYKHYLDEYQRDTTDLNLTEQGAYRTLLDAYYAREGPLPCDQDLLYRICRAHRASEKKAVDKVVHKYFTNSGGTVKNKRADQEIVKYQSQCSANRRPNRQPVDNSSKSENVNQNLHASMAEKTTLSTTVPDESGIEPRSKIIKDVDVIYPTRQNPEARKTAPAARQALDLLLKKTPPRPPADPDQIERNREVARQAVSMASAHHDDDNTPF